MCIQPGLHIANSAKDDMHLWKCLTWLLHVHLLGTAHGNTRVSLSVGRAKVRCWRRAPMTASPEYGRRMVRCFIHSCYIINVYLFTDICISASNREWTWVCSVETGCYVVAFPFAALQPVCHMVELNWTMLPPRGGLYYSHPAVDPNFCYLGWINKGNTESLIWLQFGCK